MARITGTSGNNTLTGTAGDDWLEGLSGNDTLSGLGGNDILIGGLGTDTAKFSGAFADYSLVAGVAGGGFRITDNNAANGNDGSELSAGNETLQFADAKVSVAWTPAAAFVVEAPNPNSYNGYRFENVIGMAEGGFAFTYRAADYSSSNDSIRVYDASGARVGSISTYGNIDDICSLNEGGFAYVTNYGQVYRSNSTYTDVNHITTLDQYIRDHHFSDSGANRITVTGPDGTDTLTSIEQLSFINMAFSIADRTKFDPLYYLERNRDVADANVDPLTHYKTSGWAEGRNPNPNLDLTKFEGLDYIASYPDLIKAFGANAYLGKAHFATAGLFEGRTTTFDGLEYIASYGDLIEAFHIDVARSASPDDIGAAHYILAGYSEHRAQDTFDAAQYIANYADLKLFFGTNYETATLHFVLAGYFEGRTDDALV